MSTSELSSNDRFDKEYPASLPGRLHWMEDRLHIPRTQILRLMRLSQADAAAMHNRPWSALARLYKTQAERAEHLLSHYLGYFDYDAREASAFPAEFARKVKQGFYSETDSIPGLASATTQAEREEALLAVIQQDGSGLLPALASFLASPERNGC